MISEYDLANLGYVDGGPVLGLSSYVWNYTMGVSPDLEAHNRITCPYCHTGMNNWITINGWTYNIYGCGTAASWANGLVSITVPGPRCHSVFSVPIDDMI